MIFCTIWPNFPRYVPFFFHTLPDALYMVCTVCTQKRSGSHYYVSYCTLNDRSVLDKSPLVSLLISDDCDVPWLFLVDLVNQTAKDSDLFKEVCV